MAWLIFLVLAAAVPAVVFLVWASAYIGSNVYVRALCRLSTDERVVVLTFDDGPHPEMTPKILDILDRHGIKAAFFLVGAEAEKNPDLVRRIASEGHIIGNHTYSHSSVFPLGRDSEVSAELEKCNKVIRDITGSEPLCFRPPFGVTNPVIGRVLKRMGFMTTGWSIRSLDTVSGDSRSKVCRRVSDKLHPGAVILLHDRCADADMLLESLINSVREKGYRFVPLTYGEGNILKTNGL